MSKKRFYVIFLFLLSIHFSIFGQESLVDYLTTEEFRLVVFNYQKNSQQWVYEGTVPCIIDFYTTWCGPCKRLSPIMDELSVKYAGKVRFYKVDIEKERELANLFGIHSIPTLLFCPMADKPQIARGLLPKEALEKAIDTFLVVE